MQSDNKNLATADNIILPMMEMSGHIRELEEKMEKTTHHNFIAVLKEVSKHLYHLDRIFEHEHINI